MQVYYVPSVWENVGSLIGGAVLPRLYENYNRREGLKQVEYLKAQNAADNLRQQMNTLTNSQNAYNVAKDSDNTAFKSLADKYNDPNTSAEEKASLANQMNAMGKEITPGLDQNTSDYWTKVLGATQDGTNANIQGLRNNYMALAKTVDPSLNTKDSNWTQQPLTTLQKKLDLATGYKNSQQNNTVAGGTFKNFSDYYGNNTAVKPIADTTLQNATPITMQNQIPANVITLGKANPLTYSAGGLSSYTQR